MMLSESMKFIYSVLKFDPFDSELYVIRSMYFTFCDPYFPMMKFSFNVVRVGSLTEGMVRVGEEMLENWEIGWPMSWVNNRGVAPQLLHMHVILVFCPNRKLNADDNPCADEAQFPCPSTTEKLLFPPIVSTVDTLYP